jgi:hypothetical protein
MIEAVEDEGNLSYDEGTRTLTVRYLTDEEATALNTLLVEPVYTIRTIPLAKARLMRPRLLY